MVAEKEEPDYLCGPLWPVRLGVRTPGFHPGSRGSNPLRATTLPLKRQQTKATHILPTLGWTNGWTNWDCLQLVVDGLFLWAILDSNR